MAITIEAYEDWGAVTGSPVRGTNRTLTTNANLKTISDPTQHYYLNDVTRPSPSAPLSEIATYSYKRYISFKVGGTYSRIKNSRIIIPQGFSSNNWKVSYKLANVYEQPTGSITSLNRYSGDYDGTLIPLTEGVTLFPFLSSSGPEYAETREITYGPNTTLWTQYLVLQFTAHESTYSDADNEGTEHIEFILDEMEI